MAVEINRRGFEHAQQLISDGRAVADERDDWSEHQPSAEDENRFIERHGWPNTANGTLASTTRNPPGQRRTTNSPIV